MSAWEYQFYRWVVVIGIFSSSAQGGVRFFKLMGWSPGLGFVISVVTAFAFSRTVFSMMRHASAQRRSGDARE